MNLRNDERRSFRRIAVLAAPIAAAILIAVSLRAGGLADDGRVGKVVDAQGIVSVKPVLGERWTPVREQLVLKPGDWIRTDARGANSVALRLANRTNLILGPMTLVELIGPTRIRLIEGELEIAPTKDYFAVKL